MPYPSCPGLKAVVFDLDGTLIDSAPDLASALNRLLAREGLGPVALAQVQTMIGDGVAKLVERGFAVRGRNLSAGELGDLARRYVADYEPNSAVETRPFPGAREALGELRAAGLALGVCTNKPEAATRAILAAFGMDPFIAAVVGGDTLPGARKPDPATLRETLARLGAGAGQAIAVGDSPNDVAAARAAGVPIVAVSFGYSRVPPAELGADRLIGRFADLGPALAEVCRARLALTPAPGGP
jgi:phosphoglycolate phosphatase